ncbi:hypothetical protein [Alteromonas sp. KUL49]|uniref:hypothetical protein n=1 Tax=Alteromonas sp. KUL49 TaxID=2480798 RepID=UPI00102F193C|nr:hypothetical protein [Alteromonas sp. KUL49]TAP40695.1 hypothetical protein EYS00_06145 [Alteromonas sp. KUL49]GEA10863.1 hypothetical protein KUL49_12380 [Alteromonas sp. KUL49]
MATPIHSKLINKAAREILKPNGLTRKGQSRIWFDDNGWWISIVEFQPSSWSKDTYLNTGINWQWYPKSDFAFDLCYRESDFVEFECEESFFQQALELAEKAKMKVVAFREALSVPLDAKNFILENTVGDRQNIWTSLNKGMACLHALEYRQAAKYFTDVIECSDNRDWALSVKTFVNNMITLTPEEQVLFVRNSISESRKMKKLPQSEVLFGNGA